MINMVLDNLTKMERESLADGIRNIIIVIVFITGMYLLS